MTDEFKYKLGWRKDPIDPRDWKFKAYPEQVAATPTSADLRQYAIPILDQGNIGSCTAHAGVAVFEWLQNFNKGSFDPHSRLFLYKEARDLGGITGDEGAYLRDTAKAMSTEGLPPEPLWPYDERFVDAEAPDAVHKAAERHVVTDYWNIEGTGTTLLTNLKAALGVVARPVMIGFMCYYSVMDVDSGGVIPVPDDYDTIVGGHAVAAMGYSDAKQAILIQNSWNTSWGAQGWGWLPYWYVTHDLVDDCWLVAKEQELNPPVPPVPVDKTCCEHIIEWVREFFG